MKTLLKHMPVLAALFLLAQGMMAGRAQFYGYGGETDLRSVLTIKADGTCEFTSDTTESRKQAEQQIRRMEQYKKAQEASEAGEEPPKPDLTATNEVKPMSDEELAKKMNDWIEEMSNNAEESETKTSVEVKPDTVVFHASRKFASLEEMLQNHYEVWRAAGVSFDNIRFETDTNGLLKVSLISTPSGNYKNMRSQMKLSGFKTEMKLIFPGKVVSSGLSGMDTNATWLAVDAKNDASLDLLQKIDAGTTVIIAEAGGLKLEQPLESRKLWRSRRASPADGDDLPIASAGPGFVAEAQSITLTTLHLFPDGKKYFHEHGGGTQSTGAVVTAKLFAPKGRTLKSVSDIRVIKAVDNKGRSLAAEPETEDGDSASDSYVRGDATSTELELRLKLPEPDAQAVDEIKAEAVATTAGKWKELTLTNLQQNATNELDLSDVLPGAKLIITKLSTKNRQFNLMATLKGPSTVKRLELRASVPGSERFNSSAYDRNSTAKGGVTTRTVNVSGYGMGMDVAIDPATGMPGKSDEASTSAAVLTIRYPEDLRRERVQFELSGLDFL